MRRFVLIVAAAVCSLCVSAQTAYKRHAGLDVNLDAGMNTDGYFGFEAGAGKRFNKNIYAGLLTGVYIGDAVMAPVAADMRVYIPLKDTKVTPMLGLTAGYAFGIDEFSYSAAEIRVMPGVMIPISETKDLSVGIGYMGFINGGVVTGGAALRLGLTLYK